ncbi:diacylglycerol/lipid kinase family protein [Spirochaeta dissipatitropha]
MNPGSRHGSSARLFSRIHRYAREAGLLYDYAISKSLDDVSVLAEQAQRQGYDIIVAVGGDGTINRVLSSFYNEEGRSISAAVMGVIYTGTSPDFCRSYGIPLDIRAAVQLIVDTAVAEESSKGSPEISPLLSMLPGLVIYNSRPVTGTFAADRSFDRSSCFGCCVNVGIGPALAEAANSGIRGRIGDKAGTFASLIRVLRRYMPGSCELDIIDHAGRLSKQICHEVYSISAGRSRYIASGIKVYDGYPGAGIKVSEPGLYLMRITRGRDWNLLRGLCWIYSGCRKNSTESFILELCREISVSVSEESIGQTIEFDGDCRGFLPCKISTVEEPLKLISRSTEPQQRESGNRK